MMRRRALFALVFVPRRLRAEVPKVERTQPVALSCQSQASTRTQVCQLTGITSARWYRACGQISAIRLVNGVAPVPRPIDRLTGTLGLSPWLNPGGRNEMEIDAGAGCTVESQARIFIAALTEPASPSGRLSVWVENTLANAANVEVRVAGRSHSLYVPPESYEVAEFPQPAGSSRLPVELTKFAEALEEGYEVRQWFLRDPSGIWNPAEAP